MSEKTYETEKSFRREAARRLQIPSLDEALWEETGGVRWADAHAQRGFALEVDLAFVVSQLRHKRRQGELPPAERITGEPKDLLMWWLRSRFTAWCLEPRAREWRHRFIPATLPEGAVDAEWIEAERGVVRMEKVRDWTRGLARLEGGCFLGKPHVRGAPDFKLAGDAQLYFSFPDTAAPRFLNQEGAPEEWWSGSPRPGGKLELDVRLPTSAIPVWPTFEGRRLMDRLSREWDKIELGTDWSLADACGFYLFGATPALSPLSAHVSGGFDAVGSAMKVTLQVDARISPDEVGRFYAQVLARDRPPGVQRRQRRALTLQKVELIDFVLARTLAGQRYKWRELWVEWRALHPDGSGLTSQASFERAFRRSFDRLNREAWWME